MREQDGGTEDKRRGIEERGDRAGDRSRGHGRDRGQRTEGHRDAR